MRDWAMGLRPVSFTRHGVACWQLPDLAYCLLAAPESVDLWPR